MTPAQREAYRYWTSRCWLLLCTASYSRGGQAGVTTAAAAVEWLSAYSRLYLSAVIPVLMCLPLSCTPTVVDIYSFTPKIIRLTENVLMHCYANKRDYSIKWCATKWKIIAAKNRFGFFYAFCSNRRVMQLSGMRLSGLHCIYWLPFSVDH